MSVYPLLFIISLNTSFLKSLRCSDPSNWKSQFLAVNIEFFSFGSYATTTNNSISSKLHEDMSNFFQVFLSFFFLDVFVFLN